MTNHNSITFCWDRRYLNYGFLSHKAKCSMSPRNCPHEVSETIRLQTGVFKTIYYCTFSPQVATKEPMTTQNQPPKTSCRLNGT
jgi:hypothetical protein